MLLFDLFSLLVSGREITKYYIFLAMGDLVKRLDCLAQEQSPCMFLSIIIGIRLEMNKIFWVQLRNEIVFASMNL